MYALSIIGVSITRRVITVLKVWRSWGSALGA
jgi:hypothetical protein